MMDTLKWFLVGLVCGVLVWNVSPAAVTDWQVKCKGMLMGVAISLTCEPVKKNG